MKWAGKHVNIWRWHEYITYTGMRKKCENDSYPWHVGYFMYKLMQ